MAARSADILTNARIQRKRELNAAVRELRAVLKKDEERDAWIAWAYAKNLEALICIHNLHFYVAGEKAEAEPGQIHYHLLPATEAPAAIAVLPESDKARAVQLITRLKQMCAGECPTALWMQLHYIELLDIALRLSDLFTAAEKGGCE